ncbi:regulator [Pseudosulfitobacter pseudonitzschiae]|uniref:regulator n=1 Tax=Pseudosulfitobacter pseudonitzschiae TaxID=1402135 RepID=UPI001AF9731E|nr:regulator [Pseudosulfitobacter pseudonitzschiae]MBM1817636.1 regulator [Pseudosulfitobacter pseudonitzschiae]MBM1834631.1 regulator [Pseudosulfitobacter pseudonitzschiae]MBM1839495.1 regulator [Pseudosulfitobacter pseudonitzschiae]MBM1844346.1 regulator [Pseudosulfitobacter pseudonitzschiae]MBM1849180.1 regulator [Pseudosulfitobacter pseudonitzschiae]
MAILKFSASAVAAQIAHARACKTFLPNWNGPVDRPALILIVGNGVHLRSNGIDGTTTRIVTTEQADPSFAFAGGMNPFRDTDWMAQRRMAFRDLTGQFYTDILDDVQVLIDRGRGVIRLATDGHSIRVFVRRASDYLIGGTYEVPSGLGGTFRVILKDACDTFAIVQNCGNNGVRKYTKNNSTPMSREREARQGIGVSSAFPNDCEDFDAMQPYRVPLDALMEIDDRRAA